MAGTQALALIGAVPGLNKCSINGGHCEFSY